ncbi:uncharacterized protein LOC117103682 [Anneissia japonica]|uniref:uncharacterized protein LOC117103682 n=1 Tax=Anneissia japonica TaxID=1529436 RepID=UPI0014257B52|nr:uncharacterized protein LOC117103682 [Anneissia japonica]XP_033100171.1 uncharacterized protein LOC117103682 [Anneissia japonica]XP_033100173.1 uncharacterized protein LOC117103682 [Anneissia japonica]
MAQPPTNPYYQEQHPPLNPYPQPPPYSASQPDPSKGAHYQLPPPHYTQQPVQNVTYVRKGPAPPAQKSSLGGLFKSLERGATSVMNSAEKSINRSIDHHSTSPTLAKFASGNVISLISKNTRQYLRILPNGGIDALGQPNDPACHFTTFNQGLNVVVLRNIANPAFHLSVIQGMTVGLVGTLLKLCQDYHIKFDKNMLWS